MTCDEASIVTRTTNAYRGNSSYNFTYVGKFEAMSKKKSLQLHYTDMSTSKGKVKSIGDLLVGFHVGLF
jgi:hypothetical protein